MAELMTDERIASTLDKINQRLKAAGLPVGIILRGRRLFLQATLPPSPGSTKTRPHQQQISCKLAVSVAGIMAAEKQARRLGGQLVDGTFTWSDWRELPATAAGPTLADWLPKMKADYLGRRGDTERVLRTWRKEYEAPLLRFDQATVLTPESIRELILSVPAQQKSRQRVANAFGRLAAVAGIALPYAIADLRGTYTSLKPAPRNLPADSLIEAIWEAIPYAPWRTVYGLIAAFGLRPHEAFRLRDIQPLPTGGARAVVDEDTKTGARFVWAIHPHWVEQWGLIEGPMPDCCLTLDNDKLGHRVSVQFRRYQVPFRPYSLRHAFARRGMEAGFPPDFLAKIMGHSLAVHLKIYRHHIEADSYQRIYQRIMG